MTPEERQQANSKLVKQLSLVVVGMFVFAVGILPPLYDVICDITGLNGKTSNEAARVEDAVMDEERTINVMFIADTDPDMPWDFAPEQRSIKVHPGEIKKIDFRVKNRTDEWLVGQAIPSVSPSQATPYFKKTECFCFNEQELAASDEKDMPLIFYVDPELPKSVTTITLSYQLFNITDRVAGRQNTVAQN
jgi:cytochrome c oxidase assembly protein subunit 11